MKRYLQSFITANRKKSILTMLYFPFYLRDIIFCIFKGLRWDSSWRFNWLPIIYTNKRGSIFIGNNFTCTSSQYHNSIGVFQKVILKALKKDSVIKIGNNVGISGCTISAVTSITLGNRVLIGSGCLISDSDAHSIQADERSDCSKVMMAPINIGDDCFIGARSIILKGVKIGEGSVIGAGSVVACDIPKGVIAAGNPAKVIKTII